MSNNTVVQEIRNSVGNGSTDPHHAIIDGIDCVIKGIENPEGHIALVNEYFGYKIAEKCGLRVPKYGFSNINDFTKTKSEYSETFPQHSICFYTHTIKNVVLLRSIRQLQKSENRYILKILLLDIVICNTDRNLGNLLLRQRKNKPLEIYPIDYTHAFKVEVHWDFGRQLQRFLPPDIELIDNEEMIEDSPILKMLIEKCCMERQDIIELIEEFKTILNGINLNSIKEEIPSDLIARISDDGLNDFVNFIKYRINTIDEYVEIIIDKIEIGR